METITIGSSKTDRYTNCSVKGLSASFNLIHSTAATAFTGNPIDLFQISVTVTLTRNGGSINIFSGTLRDLIAGTNFMKNGFKAFSSDITTFGKVQLVQAAGVFEVMTVPFVIPFDCVINLQGGDMLDYQVTFTTGSGGTVVGASSTVIIDALLGVGIEYGTPVFKADAIDGSQGSYGATPGKNTNKIIYLNYDKKSYLTASNTLNNVNINSDKWNFSGTTNQLIGLNQYMAGDIPTNYEPYQSICIYDDMNLQNTKINLTLTAANINTNYNVVFWRRFITSDWLRKRALAMEAKHDARNEGQFK